MRIAEDLDMGVRAVVIGLAVGGAAVSSCASTARDTLVDIYNNDTGAGLDEACQIQAKTFEVATDAYLATNGQPPERESDLVPDFVLESSDAWVFDADASTSFVPASDGDCAGFDIGGDLSPSIGQNAVDRIADARDTSCDTNKRQIETALVAHLAINGEEATELSELTEIGVENLTDRWMLEATADSSAPLVVPVVGGPCDR